jgi:hypothetical protein
LYTSGSGSIQQCNNTGGACTHSSKPSAVCDSP